MSFPSKKELDRAKKSLKNADAVRLLPLNATKADKLKFELCKKFVSHILEHEMTQAALAKELKIDAARLNEIVKYKIDLFTIDKLIEYAERLDSKLKISVA